MAPCFAKDMRLLLVYPEITCSVTNTSTYSAPLGLGAVGTFCQQRIPNLEVKILDGSMVPHAEQVDVAQSFKPDVIGVAPTLASQANGYEVAKAAKDQGATVLFGGVNSTNMWRNMLQNQRFIDGVVLYEGEIPLYMILNRLAEKGFIGNRCLEGIPNVAYRDDQGNLHEPKWIYVPSLDDLPDIDYSLFDLQRFFEQTRQRGFGNAITYYGGKGCSKRSGAKIQREYTWQEYNDQVTGMDTCTFCGRNELGFRSVGSDREARIVRTLHDQFGVRGFFNVQDTAELRNTAPLGMEDSWFRIFMAAEATTERNVQRLMQRYGPQLILQIGVEAATPEMRTVYGKKEIDAEDILSKSQMLLDHGIQLHASFILGGRGETRESMRCTTDIAKQLATLPNATWILISPEMILPGSPDFNALLQMPRMMRKYGSADILDIPEINRDFLSQFTPGLKREDILEEIKATFDVIKQSKSTAVLDVKGVNRDEEAFVDPERPYAETGSCCRLDMSHSLKQETL